MTENANNEDDLSDWLEKESNRSAAEGPTRLPGSTTVRITFEGLANDVFEDIRDFTQSRRPKPRLTDAQCKGIRRRAAAGETRDSLAASYGVSREKVRKVLMDGDGADNEKK